MLKNLFSRRNERQADVFAVKMGHGEALSSGLVKIYEKNSGNMDPDPLYAAVMHTHPTLAERLELIQAEMNKAK